MKKITFFLFLIFLAANNCAEAQSRNAGSITLEHKTKQAARSPILTLLTKSFDADTVLLNAPLTFDVSYKNSGDEPLIISKVRTSCSCTVASYSSIPLPKNQSDKIVLKLNTDKPGTFNKTVAIYSNASNAYDKSIESSRIVFQVKWVVLNKEEKSENKKSKKNAK